MKSSVKQSEIELSSLKDKMRNTLYKDQDLIQNSKPAINRLLILPDCMQKLFKLRSVVDADLLHVLREWLEPLPDNTLPNLDIRLQILEFLLTINPSRDQLVSSEIGKIVYTYSKNKKTEPEIRKVAKQVVKKWTIIAMNEDAF